MSETTVYIKPLSVNQCWTGRRFKSPNYHSYEEEMFLLLPKQYSIPEEGDLKLELRFGVSSKSGDADNLVKPFQDILQKKYGFNDKRIYELNVTKEDVEKGDEYVSFQITQRKTTS